MSVPVEGTALLPELYRVPEAALATERRQPGSQPRQPNENVPLLWTQSLTWLADLLLQGLISPADLDPCGRRLPSPLPSLPPPASIFVCNSAASPATRILPVTPAC